jgi:glutamate synthase (NADPH/NADH) small chain
MAGGFDAVMLAMGLGAGMTLTGGNGPRPRGVMEANDFLRQMNANPTHACGPRVAVIGGGNTAMDAAAMAATRGGKDVFIVYRRSYSQMPAWPAERNAALDAGVHLLVLCRPIRYITDNAGRVSGIELVRTELGPADESGRRKPIDVPGSEHVLSVDLAIEAIGEKADAALAAAMRGVEMDGGLVRADDETLETTRPGVWAAGDLINGGQTVVRAVADGKRAADQIDRRLR